VANLRRNVARLTGRVHAQAGLWLMLAVLAGVLALPGAARAEAPPQEVPPSYALVAENDSFALHVDETTLAFKLLDKRSGYLWHSGIDELIEGDRLNSSWQAFAKSGLSIEYLDERASNRRVSIANSEHTLEVTPIEGGISAVVTFTEYGITVGVTLQLEPEGVRVEVPYDSIIEENSDFRLGKVYVYPFLGATRGGSVPGYILLPDGSGSLIRFADTTRARNIFYSRYYGADLGMLSIMPYDGRVTTPSPVGLPVFGMTHIEGQNAYLAVMEDGASYGELQVHPAGVITNFNFVLNAFVYNEAYFQATNRSGAGVTTVQRQPNRFDAVVHYRFLTGDQASYIGMAHSLQQYLVERGLLRQNDFTAPSIGIRLEFLGGDKEQILFWNRFVPMTTIDQMRTILTALQISNPEVILYGWQPSGATAMPPTSLALEGGLGGVDALRELADWITAGGGNFSLYLDPQVAIWDEPGYSPRTDLAMSITNSNLIGYNRSAQYYFTANAVRERLAWLARDAAERLGAGLALDSIGFMVYSDFRENPPFNREMAIEAYQALLAEAQTRLGFYRPNAYMLGFAAAYYDMPLGDNGYIYTTEPVPFLPAVLAGYVPYYGSALNFSSNRQDDLLRHLEYGIYPSYFVTHEVTANMINTRSAWIYTSSYTQWGDEIRRTYDWMNNLLAPVRGQAIVAHQRLADGVFATTYDGGGQVIVNYTDRPFSINDVTVEARNAQFVEGLR